MSVRTEARADLSQAMQQTLHIDSAVMQSAAAAAGPGPLMAPAPSGMASATGALVENEQHLAQANDFNTSNPEHPLKRTVVINIRASLADLCLRKQKATWAPPSADATRAIFQQASLPSRSLRSALHTARDRASMRSCGRRSSRICRATPRRRAT
jgi:hypothetical protein